MNENAKSALSQYRARVASGEIEKAQRLNPVEKARQNPQSMKLAIRAHCYQCVCGENWIEETRNCAIVDCALWSHRPNQP